MPRDTGDQEKEATVGSHRLVEVVAHRVGQGANGIIEDEQVLVLVFAKGKDEGVQNVAEVGHQFRAGLFLQGGEGTGRQEGLIGRLLMGRGHMQVETGIGGTWDQPVRIH